MKYISLGALCFLTMMEMSHSESEIPTENLFDLDGRIVEIASTAYTSPNIPEAQMALNLRNSWGEAVMNLNPEHFDGVLFCMKRVDCKDWNVLIKNREHFFPFKINLQKKLLPLKRIEVDAAYAGQGIYGISLEAHSVGTGNIVLRMKLIRHRGDNLDDVILLTSAELPVKSDAETLVKSEKSKREAKNGKHSVATGTFQTRDSGSRANPTEPISPGKQRPGQNIPKP